MKKIILSITFLLLVISCSHEGYETVVIDKEFVESGLFIKDDGSKVYKDEEYEVIRRDSNDVPQELKFSCGMIYGRLEMDLVDALSDKSKKELHQYKKVFGAEIVNLMEIRGKK